MFGVLTIDFWVCQCVNRQIFYKFICMKPSLIILFLVLLLGSDIFCQTLTGVVYDDNKKPLPGASVYFDGTTIGTITDQNGRYYLEISDKINSPLVISFVGYLSAVFINPYNAGDRQVYLKPKLTEFSEVIIPGKKPKFSREQNIKIFREQFLGITQAGRSCKILNEEDLTVHYDYVSNILHVSAVKPLFIENPFLGYKVVFDLMDFSIDFDMTSVQRHNIIKSFYAGTTFFIDTGKYDKKITKRREETYAGSRMYFFRNMYNDGWNAGEFRLYNDRLRSPVSPDDFFRSTDTSGIKKVTIIRSDSIKTRNNTKIDNSAFSLTLKVFYKLKDESLIIFRTNKFFVDRFGNYAPVDSILFTGEMAKKRVGDLLPINFNSDSE